MFNDIEVTSILFYDCNSSIRSSWYYSPKKKKKNQVDIVIGFKKKVDIVINRL